MTRRLSTLSYLHRISGKIEGGSRMADALRLPMLPDILDTMDANDGARFFVLGCYQSFKSLVGQGRMIRNHYVRGRPAIWYAPTDDFAKDFADAKLNMLMDNLPEMRAVSYTDDKTKSAKLRRILAGGASHLILSAKTENDRHGKTACDLYMDEPHLYEPGWIDQISNRRGAYTESESYTETYMSTGLTVGDVQGGEAAKVWATTDQRTWHCRCPDCNQLFEPLYLHREKQDDPASPIVGGLRYEKRFLPNGMIDELAIAASLTYECPRCHARRPDSAATRALYSGTAERPRGIYVAKNPNAAPRSFGWNFNALALRPWLPIAVKFETAQLARARGDLTPLANCIREELAGVWDPEKYYRPEQFDRYQHPTPYLMREEWADETKDNQGNPFRFATVDVQLDYYVLVVRKWGKWSASRLHFCAICLSPSEIALHLTAEKVPAHRVFMDARHDPQKVRRICALMGWMTMMGDKAMRDYLHEDGIRRIFDQPKVIDAMTGTHVPGRSQGAVVEFLFSKNSALNRLALLRDPDSRSPDGAPLWTAASDAPEWYFKQINAHFRKRQENADGSHYYVWHGQKDDHAGDCEAMGVVSASMANLTGAESLEPASAK